MENGWMVVLIPDIGMSHMDGHVRAYDRESMKSILLGSHNLIKLNRTSSSICVRFIMEQNIRLWQDLLIIEELAFLVFRKQKTPDFKRHQNKFVQLYSPYLCSQQLRLESSICNPQNFQVHWQSVYITNKLKLKRTFIAKLNTTDMVEQSKTHPFNFHKKLKHSYRT